MATSTKTIEVFGVRNTRRCNLDRASVYVSVTDRQFEHLGKLLFRVASIVKALGNNYPVFAKLIENTDTLMPLLEDIMSSLKDAEFAEKAIAVAEQKFSTIADDWSVTFQNDAPILREKDGSVWVGAFVLVTKEELDGKTVGTETETKSVCAG